LDKIRLQGKYEIFQLPKFTYEEVLQYIGKKLLKLGIRIKAEQTEVIAKLSNGNLFLVDLSLELVSSRTKELFEAVIDLSPNEQNFSLYEQTVFKNYMLAIKSMPEFNRLIRELYHCSPMDYSLHNLMAGGTDDYNFNKLKNQIYVKLLPDSSIRLHDKMVEMITRFCLEESRDRSHQTLGDTEKNEEVFELITKQTRRGYSKKFIIALNKYREYENIKSNELLLWETDLLILKHSIHRCCLSDSDVSNETELTAIIEEVENKFNVSDVIKQRQLVAMIRELSESTYRNRMPIKLQNEIDFLHLKYLSLAGEYEEAAQYGSNILERLRLNLRGDIPDYNYEQHVRSYLWAVNHDIGKLQLAIDNLMPLVEIKSQLSDCGSQVHYLLGLTYRTIGDFSTSKEEHLLALKSAMQAGPDVVKKTQLSDLQASLSFAYALTRDIDSARRLNMHAYDLCFENGNRDDTRVASSLNILGRVRTEFDDFDAAILHLTEALEIIESDPNIESQSKGIKFAYKVSMYLGLAQALILKNDYDAANRILDSVSEYDIQKRLLAELYNLKGCLHYRKSDYTEAAVYFYRSYEVSDDMECSPYAAQAAAGYIRSLMREQIKAHGDIDKQTIIIIKTFQRWLKSVLKKSPSYQYTWAIPLLQKQLADFHLLLNDPVTAIAYYKLSLPNIAKYGRHEPFTITGQLKNIQDNVFKVIIRQGKHEVLRRLASDLEKFWWDEKLFVTYPEVLYILGKWRSGSFDEWGGAFGEWGGIIDTPHSKTPQGTIN